MKAVASGDQKSDGGSNERFYRYRYPVDSTSYKLQFTSTIPLNYTMEMSSMPASQFVHNNKHRSTPILEIFHLCRTRLGSGDIALGTALNPQAMEEQRWGSSKVPMFN
jgi:hypothetical protein